MTALYSILHFFVDGICAIAMFSRFSVGEHGYWHFFIYNFCAFALQMPFGIILDFTKEKKKGMMPYMFACTGVILTIFGAVFHPVILGLGNALFHVGGGVDVIYDDYDKKGKGQLLGIFVAPGALGLYLGTLLANNSASMNRNIVCAISVLLIFSILFFLWRNRRVKNVTINIEETIDRKSSTILLVTLGCLMVVILRSYIGMAIDFSWKSTVYMGIFSVLAVVLGKMAGGILAARFGMEKVMILSLLCAALTYYFSDRIICGILALFFFNMTMPITLYLLVCHLKTMPGFSFGLLTFGLFLGFLPIYFDLESMISGNILGMIGSIMSLVILSLVSWVHRRMGE